MKNLITTLISLTFLFFSTSVHSQSQKYLEVIVSDVVLLEIQSLTYNISSLPQYNQINGMFEPSQPGDTAAQKNIELLLQKHGFSYKSLVGGTGYSINNYRDPDTSPVLVVDLKDKTELEKLVNLLKPLPNISGNIGSVDYSSVEEAEQVLMQKLIEKGKKKASLLAESMNLKVGEILSFQEVNKELVDVLEEALQGRTVPGWHTNIDSGLREEVQKTAIMRFQLH